MKKVLALAAIAEGATGIALIVAPSLVARLLLGTELTGVSMVVGPVAGMALIGLAFACVPGQGLVGMLTYSALVTLYLLYVAVRGEWVGLLLWPAVLLHAILTILLARVWFRQPTIS